MAEFNDPGRALMKDGLYDDGLVRTHRAADPSKFKIGKSAQNQALREYGGRGRAAFRDVRTNRGRGEAGGHAHVELRRFFDDKTPNFLRQSWRSSRHRPGKGRRSSSALRLWMGRAMADCAFKLKVQRSLRSDRVEQRKTQEKVFTSHLVEAETAKRVIEGGEEIPGSRLGARVAWSL